MEDSRIIDLYWQRAPEAIAATASKYGGYCHTIAQNILDSREDAEECVNDTYLSAWNAIPPQRPGILRAFLGRITRNLALDRWRSLQADKRGGGQLPLVLEELGDCVSGSGLENELDRRQLIWELNSFLAGLPPKKRNIFLCRYWYADSVEDIAARYHMSTGSVSSALSRIRTKLRAYLTERGFEL